MSQRIKKMCMKVKCVVGVVLGLVGVVFSNFSQAQENPRLEITTNKTTLVVSHYKIRSVNMGSGDVYVQRAKGIDTVLEVKAARPNFPETNMTIVTADGLVHMFLVDYNAQPQTLRYTLSSGVMSPLERFRINEVPSFNEALFEHLSDSILQKRLRFLRIHDRSFGVSARLAGIYIQDGVLFFRLHLNNETQIPYDISQLNFYIRDKDQSKRTASQDLTLSPLYFAGNHWRVDGNTKLDFVAALTSFTIPDKKVLFIVLKEKNGGRLLRLRLKNKMLMRARQI